MNIKGMNKDMMCNDFQFEIGKEYKIENNEPLQLCTNKVFHYYKDIREAHKHYQINGKNRYFEIEVLGDEVTDGSKYGSNHIKIIREINRKELDELVFRKNGNTGVFNIGDNNSGDYNSGDCNSGDYNIGDYNSGDYNSGDFNIGDHNSGGFNIGDYNSGYFNIGNNNSGKNNRGDYNSGDHNHGDYNSGDFNIGDHNSGDHNHGDFNIGTFNSCNFSNGIFCTEEDKNIRIFNKPSGMSLKEFYNSKYYNAIISKKFDLRGKSYKDACKLWWESISEEDKEIIKSIPNFDKNIFLEITGIDVEASE